jgi:hypothetical protein
MQIINCPSCQINHYCYEWDYMKVYPNTPEYQSCVCFKPCELCNNTGKIELKEINE